MCNCTSGAGGKTPHMKKKPISLPKGSKNTEFLWYTGKNWIADIAGTTGKYKPVQLGRLFRVFRIDSPLLTVRVDHDGNALFLNEKMYEKNGGETYKLHEKKVVEEIKPETEDDPIFISEPEEQIPEGFDLVDSEANEILSGGFTGELEVADNEIVPVITTESVVPNSSLEKDVDWSKLTVKKLRVKLDEMGLSTKGKKAELIERIESNR